MDDRETIKLFLEKGFQISKDVLPLVISEPNFIIDEINKLNPRPFIITQEHIKKIKNKPDIKPKPNIVKVYHQEKTQVKTNDFVRSFVIKYEKIKKIIQENNNLERLVSINKITPQTHDFSIIGIVRDRLRNQLVVEDMSGEIEIHFDSNIKDKLVDVDLDDVAGFKCRRSNSKFTIETVYFPDIQINREINRLNNDLGVLFLPDNFVNLELLGDMRYDFYFFFDNNDLMESINKTDKLIKENMAEPTTVELHDIKLLFIPRLFYERHGIDVSSNLIEKFLKKRCLLPSNNRILNTDKNDFILTEAPDIVVTNIEPGMYKNYKGTTIISVGNYKMYYINLKSREVVLIE